MSFFNKEKYPLTFLHHVLIDISPYIGRKMSIFRWLRRIWLFFYSIDGKAKRFFYFLILYWVYSVTEQSTRRRGLVSIPWPGIPNNYFYSISPSQNQTRNGNCLNYYKTSHLDISQYVRPAFLQTCFPYNKIAWAFFHF